MKCPVCDETIKKRQDYMEHVLMEESASCKDEHHFYSYNYHTGHTEEVVGGVIFHSHYNDLREERKLKGKQFTAVVELEREYYQKKLMGSESK